jgi:hypothetical protein
MMIERMERSSLLAVIKIKNPAQSLVKYTDKIKGTVNISTLDALPIYQKDFLQNKRDA